MTCDTYPDVYFVGVKLKDVYNFTLQFVKSKKPNLVDKLTKNFGWALLFFILCFMFLS